MVHILGGVLAGGSFSPIRNRNQAPNEPDNIGHFFLAIDPKVFRPDGGFQSDLSAVVGVLHGATPADPAQPVLVAGDPERSMRAERLKLGIPIPLKLHEQLRDVASACGAEFLLGGAAG
jgi:LDH2 family malate/lactate/ureidoglycolate dehydrogenase